MFVVIWRTLEGLVEDLLLCSLLKVGYSLLWGSFLVLTAYSSHYSHENLRTEHFGAFGIMKSSKYKEMGSVAVGVVLKYLVPINVFLYPSMDNIQLVCQQIFHLEEASLRCFIICSKQYQSLISMVWSLIFNSGSWSHWKWVGTLTNYVPSMKNECNGSIYYFYMSLGSKKAHHLFGPCC